ncbi:MAG: pyruvate flavodoxin/ferredoxin oxidoreductase [Deltaproteobacteria bacterium]|nr:pyruvate flavodoxin/ferredoxin oxidoreductase [Deltaproteobacteria bacterium]
MAESLRCTTGKALTDGSVLVALGALHAGVDFFVGYPITPASSIFAEMIRRGVGIAAPDEITALQYLIGASLNGRKAMTATSGPGFLLMAEGIGEALMMEAPLTVVLVQRLGPATGSATMNAQGDVGLVGSIVSGGFLCPVVCPARVEECAELTVRAVNLAETLRVPAVLLTEKEMVVGKRSLDLSRLRLPEPVARTGYGGDPAAFASYGNLDAREVPAFRPLGDREVQLRVTASTHDARGMIASFSERVRHSTERLMVTDRWRELYPAATLDRQEGAGDLVLSYGFTSYAAEDAVGRLRAAGHRVSHLTVRTIYPVLREELRAALAGVQRVFLPEENLTGQYRRLLLAEGVLGGLPPEAVVSLAVMGRPIAPEEIVRAVLGTASRRGAADRAGEADAAGGASGSGGDTAGGRATREVQR